MNARQFHLENCVNSLPQDVYHLVHNFSILRLIFLIDTYCNNLEGC
jgi:hypothetical protein